MEKSFATISKGKIYYIASDIEITKSTNSVAYNNPIISSYIGEGATKRTITFNLTGNTDTLFASMLNASFNNIHFVINIDEVSGNRDFDAYGIFANSVVGTTFTNCTFGFSINLVSVNGGILYLV